MKRLRVRIIRSPRDCWIGVYWTTQRTTRGRLTTWFVCIVPTLPIVIQWATDMVDGRTS